jgi:hypothetical protein
MLHLPLTSEIIRSSSGIAVEIQERRLVVYTIPLGVYDEFRLLACRAHQPQHGELAFSVESVPRHFGTGSFNPSLSCCRAWLS